MTFDVNGYPDEETLNEIEKFSLGKNLENLHEFIRLIKDHWNYAELGFFKYHPDTGYLELHTGGWSGNESIISAIRKTPMFWSLYWYKSKRGGHYWFELWQFDETGKKCLMVEE